MRIWSIHPRYLDTKGLVALWRETLLAKNVLESRTKGYRSHPQLIRFSMSDHSLDAINFYLKVVYDEAKARDYNFDKNKIGNINSNPVLPVTDGQIRYEFKHLMSKLKIRDPERFKAFSKIQVPKVHPLFKKKEGGIENWEKTK
jgi:hypothetical protein